MNKLKSIFALAILLFVTTFVTGQTKVEWKEKKGIPHCNESNISSCRRGQL